MKIILLFVSFVAVTLENVIASEHGPVISKYAGEETRKIKSLFDLDIQELRRGGGWGMAKAAELNGVPGPIHLLDLKDEISLTTGQIEAVISVFERMRDKARHLGGRLIDLEEKLEIQFQNRSVSDQILRNNLNEIGLVRTELRYVHLSAHLETVQLISEDQIARYNMLRGYGDKRVCENVPSGHNVQMWRKHNGCE